MLLLPGLQLVRTWSIASSLELFNLVSIEDSVVQNLPLLGGALVHFHLLGLDLWQSNLLLQDSLQLNEHLFHFWVVVHSGDSSFLPDEGHLVVGIIDFMRVWTEVPVHDSHLLWQTLEVLPELLSGFLRSRIIVPLEDFLWRSGWLGFIEKEFIPCTSLALGVELWVVRDLALGLSGIIIVISKFLLGDVVLAVSEWKLPVVLVQVWVIRLVQTAGSRRWVSVHDLLGGLVVLVTWDFDAVFESLPQLLSSLVGSAE